MPDAAASTRSAKAALRAQMRERLARITPVEREERSTRLVVRLTALAEWQRATTVLLFAPMVSEPDLDLLWSEPERLAGKRAFYPRVGAGELTIHEVVHPRLLAPGHRGMREPVSDGALALGEPTAWPGLILVPGLGFSPAGVRLGRGGGFYDRLLKDAPAGVVKIGVCFEVQMDEGLPVEAHDQPVHIVVTDEKRWL